jgi:hypothetical protein
MVKHDDGREKRIHRNTEDAGEGKKEEKETKKKKEENEDQAKEDSELTT